MKSRSVEAKKFGINSPSERRTEITNATFTSTNVDDRRYRPNKFFNKTNQSARTFKRITDSNSNEGMNEMNEGDNTNPPPKKVRNKINRTNVAVSRSTAEEKNERTFILRMTGASPGIKEKKRRFFSRLPIRTWKRLRTREPAALRLKSDVTNGNDNRKLEAEDIVITKSNDHLQKIKDDKVHEEIRAVRATANHIDIKRNDRSEIGSLSADKPKITSSNVKNLKGFKDLRRGSKGGRANNERRE